MGLTCPKIRTSDHTTFARLTSAVVDGLPSPELWESGNPAAELELPRVGYKLPNVMNKEEVERVLSQPKIEVPLGIRDRAMLELLYSSGLRRMELLHLRLYDVDQQHGLVTVREGKGKRDRVVPSVKGLWLGWTCI